METSVYKIYDRRKKWGKAIVDINRMKEFETNYLPYMQSLKKAKILDVGCGQGFMLDFVRRQGFRNAIGVDVSENLVKLCRAKGHNVVCADARDFLKNTAEQFDIIVMNDILEHFNKKDAIELLKLIHSKMRAGGLLLVKTCNSNYPFSNYYRYADLTHETIYEEESLGYLLELTGFRVHFIGDFKAFPRNLIRRWIRRLVLKTYQLVFLVCVGRKLCEMNIFAVARTPTSAY